LTTVGVGLSQQAGFPAVIQLAASENWRDNSYVIRFNIWVWCGEVIWLGVMWWLTGWQKDFGGFTSYIADGEDEEVGHMFGVFVYL